MQKKSNLDFFLYRLKIGVYVSIKSKKYDFFIIEDLISGKIPSLKNESNGQLIVPKTFVPSIDLMKGIIIKHRNHNNKKKIDKSKMLKSDADFKELMPRYFIHSVVFEKKVGEKIDYENLERYNTTASAEAQSEDKSTAGFGQGEITNGLPNKKYVFPIFGISMSVRRNKNGYRRAMSIRYN